MEDKYNVFALELNWSANELLSKTARFRLDKKRRYKIRIFFMCFSKGYRRSPTTRSTSHPSRSTTGWSRTSCRGWSRRPRSSSSWRHSEWVLNTYHIIMYVGNFSPVSMPFFQIKANRLGVRRKGWWVVLRVKDNSFWIDSKAKEAAWRVSSKISLAGGGKIVTSGQVQEQSQAKGQGQGQSQGQGQGQGQARSAAQSLIPQDINPAQEQTTIATQLHVVAKPKRRL